MKFECWKKLGKSHSVITLSYLKLSIMVGPVAEMENVIAQAVREAESEGVHGKALTPFLLSRVSEITRGGSQAANLALLRNNARAPPRWPLRFRRKIPEPLISRGAYARSAMSLTRLRSSDNLKAPTD